MSTKQTTLIDEPTTDNINRPASTTSDAIIVQNLEPGNVITATQLTTRQHRKYLQSDDTTLMDVYCEETTFVVLDTPDEDDGTNVFAAKIIRLNVLDETNLRVEEVSHAYNPDGLETWNITTPQVPYENNGTGVVISRLGENENPVTQILRDISITGQEEL